MTDFEALCRSILADADQADADTLKRTEEASAKIRAAFAHGSKLGLDGLIAEMEKQAPGPAPALG